MKSYRDDPILMKCGHVRAARMIECRDGALVTTCWACKVEQESKRETK
jgi:hypothetical protein